MSYAVLQSFCNSPECAGQTNTSIPKNITACGANDCQDPTEIQDAIDQYVPSRIATYVLLGAMLCMQLIGIILLIVFLPHVDVSSNATHVSRDEKNNCFQVSGHTRLHNSEKAWTEPVTIPG